MHILKFVTLAGLALVNGVSVDYSENGRYWSEDFPKCAGDNQSPIDLSTKAEIVNGKEKEDFHKFYQDVYGKTVDWDNRFSTTQVVIDSNAGKSQNKGGLSNSFFRSKFGKNEFDTPELFEASHFLFHWKSQHTIDGARYDFEMNTMHFPEYGLDKNGYVAAGLGIIFDTQNYDKNVTEEEVEIIDKFFDQLQFWQTSNSKPKQLVFGKLMTALDLTNRWVYKGSVPMPPCATTVWWNVAKKVYPIKKKHLDQFIDKQLPRNTEQNLKLSGNWRENQPTTKKHELKIIALDSASVKQVIQVEKERAVRDMNKARIQVADFRAEISSQKNQIDVLTTAVAILICATVVSIIAFAVLVCFQCKTMKQHEKNNSEVLEHIHNSIEKQQSFKGFKQTEDDGLHTGGAAVDTQRGSLRSTDRGGSIRYRNDVN